MKLIDAGYDCCLSCQSNRPSFIFSQHLDKRVKDIEGQRQAFMKHKTKKLWAVSVKDCSVCHFLITVGCSSIVEEKRKRKRSTMLKFYNDNMNGVDIADSSIHLYLNKHRNIKFTKAMMNFLIKLLLTNDFKVYKYFHPKFQQKKFIELVLDDILCLFGDYDVHTS